MPANIPLFTSQKFKFWSFASMVMLVFVHGYNLNLRYLQPATTVSEPLTINSFVQYFLSNGLFRFFIPMLFIISGYLYALQYAPPYKAAIRKRVRTLLVPYLLWSAGGLLLTYLFELSAYGRDLMQQTHLMQFGADRVLVHDYRWYELLLRWLLLPVPYQLWFVRVLFIYNLAYPALCWCVLKAPIIFFTLAALLWLANAGTPLVESEGLLFFSLGIWMQKRNFNIATPNKWLRPLPWATVFITVAAIKTWLAFNGPALIGNTVYPVLQIMYKLTVISGLVTAWYGCDALVRRCMANRTFVWLSAFSFIIYAAHAPIIAYAINMAFPLVQNVPNYRLLTYLLLPLTILGLCVLLGAILRSLTPKLYAVLTGGIGA